MRHSQIESEPSAQVSPTVARPLDAPFPPSADTVTSAQPLASLKLPPSPAETVPNLTDTFKSRWFGRYFAPSDFELRNRGKIYERLGAAWYLRNISARYFLDQKLGCKDPSNAPMNTIKALYDHLEFTIWNEKVSVGGVVAGLLLATSGSNWLTVGHGIAATIFLGIYPIMTSRWQRVRVCNVLDRKQKLLARHNPRDVR